MEKHKVRVVEVPEEPGRKLRPEPLKSVSTPTSCRTQRVATPVSSVRPPPSEESVKKRTTKGMLPCITCVAFFLRQVVCADFDVDRFVDEWAPLGSIAL